MAAHPTLCPIYDAQSRSRQARNQERLIASVDAMAQQMREINRGQIQPEAPSPAPVPQPSVIYAEPIENHNNREIIQLKEKIKSLEEENKSLREENKKLRIRDVTPVKLGKHHSPMPIINPDTRIENMRRIRRSAAAYRSNR